MMGGQFLSAFSLMDHQKKKSFKSFALIITHGQIFPVSVVEEMQKLSKYNKK